MCVTTSDKTDSYRCSKADPYQQRPKPSGKHPKTRACKQLPDISDERGQYQHCRSFNRRDHKSQNTDCNRRQPHAQNTFYEASSNEDHANQGNDCKGIKHVIVYVGVKCEVGSLENELDPIV